MTTRRPVQAAKFMNEAAAATADQSKPLVEAIIEAIGQSKMAHHIVMAPFDRYTRLTCHTGKRGFDSQKIIVQVPKDGETVDVRRSIDPGTDIVHPVNKITVAGQDAASVAKQVVDTMGALKDAQNPVLKSDAQEFRR